MISRLQLMDAANTPKQFTWRKLNSDIFSTIDRLLYSCRTLLLKTFKNFWSLSMFDHAAMEATLQPFSTKSRHRNKLARLDSSLRDDPIIKEQIEQECSLACMLGHWDPHLKLEFLICVKQLSLRKLNPIVP